MGSDGDEARFLQWHGKVLAVYLVAVGLHGDEILAGRQIDPGRLIQIILIAPGIDRRPAGHGPHARPVALVRVKGIADSIGGRIGVGKTVGRIKGVTRIVDVDEKMVWRSDHFAGHHTGTIKRPGLGTGTHHLQSDGRGHSLQSFRRLRSWCDARRSVPRG